MTFRIEQKFNLHHSKIIDLIQWIFDEGGRKIYKKRNINSLYFDNINCKMYEDSEEGSVPRKKIRIRKYGTLDIIENKDVNLEIKINACEGQFKNSKKIDNKEYNYLIQNGYFDKDYGICIPKIYVQYERNYFLVKNNRLTLDTKIKYYSFNRNQKYEIFKIDNKNIVEIKSTNTHLTDYLLKEFPFQKIRFSKYARGINIINYENNRL